MTEFVVGVCYLALQWCTEHEDCQTSYKQTVQSSESSTLLVAVFLNLSGFTSAALYLQLSELTGLLKVYCRSPLCYANLPTAYLMATVMMSLTINAETTGLCANSLPFNCHYQTQTTARNIAVGHFRAGLISKESGSWRMIIFACVTYTFGRSFTLMKATATLRHVNYLLAEAQPDKKAESVPAVIAISLLL